MKLSSSCQFLALKGHPLWMHHFIGKLFVLHSHSNCLKKAQASFRVLRRMDANIWNTFPFIYSDLLGLFLFQFSAQAPKRTNMADTISSLSQINLLNWKVKAKRRLCTKSNNSLACLVTTDSTIGLIVQPLTMTNFSLMHKGSRIQTVTCTLINVL